MALVLLGIAAAGVLLPFGGGAAIQAEGWHKTLAAKLANDLLEQVVATPFDQTVTTWNGYTEPQGQVKDANNVAFADPMYAAFSRRVSCDYVRVLPQQWFSPVCFVVASVEVCYQGRPVAVLDRLISK